MDVILFGPPGAGKGTQATQVSARLDVPHVSTGDIFRRHLKEGTELGQLARSFIDRGQLVPDDVVVEIVASRLTEADAKTGALFDGFPRTVRQAELLQKWLLDHGRKIDLAINLGVPDEIVVARLSGRRTCITCGATFHVVHNPPPQKGICNRCAGKVVQREDDHETTVRARIETYHRETAPVLNWLRKLGVVQDIDANQPIDTVKEDIAKTLSA